MQVRSLYRKTNTAATMRSKLSGFQQFTEKMIAKFGQEPEDSDRSGVDSSSQNFTDALPAVKIVLDFIQKMAATLLDYHNQSLERVGQCTKIYDICIDTHINGNWTSWMNESLQNWTAAQNMHEQCREDRRTMQDDENKACKAYDDYRWNPSADSDALLPDCVGNKGPASSDFPRATNAFYEEYVRAQTTATRPPADNSSLFKMEKCLEETADWLHGSDGIVGGPTLGLYDKYLLCQRDEEPACAQKTSTCRNKQHDFERKHCLWNFQKDLKCSTIHDCVTTGNKTCADICDGVEDDAAARAADIETGKRLTCLLEVLFGKENASFDSGFAPRLGVSDRQEALDECKNAIYNTSFWEIKCPTDWAPHFGKLPFSCSCGPLSGSAEFNQRHYFVDPPALGQECTGEQETGDYAMVEQCCKNKNISEPSVCDEPDSARGFCTMLSEQPSGS